ncbi:flagellar hook-associated protein FlgL [Rhodoferax fermentans]|uniref:Flagellar hook-associated protein 3 n=1 Tax=Rhodoferax fermentans TaxID=28066 RepID=A0A1T1AXC8_RHOFE|nr:flagellar hook-associated protein FlgL [Rhodoferax fermentans]MBK1683853.1 flagellar hook-associated protein 3 [Rhodoferax fermentans]OOV08779.1 flagellar hook-associated protein 3 [Rhodoferax fermentans]
MSNFSRIGTANTYDSAVRNIAHRQSALANLQENLTSGKRVVRPSDDPTAAANAERAMTRISRIATDQRVLESQRNAIAQAESTLGEVTDVLQRFRELVVNAGDGVHSSAERRSIALELQGLRDQVFSLANTKDTNGLPLFGALASALAPFVGPQAGAPDYNFQGLPGQSASNEVAIPFTLDGDAAFMHDPTRDRVFNVDVSNSVDGLISADRTLTTSAIKVTNSATVKSTAAAAAAVAPPNNAPYPSYAIAFTAVDSTTVPGTTTATYSITETPSVTPLGAPAPFANVTVSFPTGSTFDITGIPGMSLTVKGTPKVNDTVTVDSSPSVFSVLDDAIKNIREAPNNNGAAQAVSQALNNIDIGMERISAARGQAGDLLNRADRITANQENRSIQLEADRSRAEDLDMIKGISDFNNQQTGYQAALQTYAKVQQLSLFNFIS